MLLPWLSSLLLGPGPDERDWHQMPLLTIQGPSRPPRQLGAPQVLHQTDINCTQHTVWSCCLAFSPPSAAHGSWLFNPISAVPVTVPWSTFLPLRNGAPWKEWAPCALISAPRGLSWSPRHIGGLPRLIQLNQGSFSYTDLRQTF